ncbi:28S ribosomal protein S31, mitochondrial isoform X2 [Arvicola amphibius]|uniref:28S ribosomal protein S31, mitochondrial isoform X2 n=1 Tax=Arvicola amphibius TaxID=1047088 RepID=UPI0018E36F9F|nr:28S ribosomal protein S31, mitochondrial isoform X2 [Arvicola amphibius]
MLHRIPAFIRPRPFSGLPLSPGNWDVLVAVSVLPAAWSGTVWTETNIQRHFGTGSSIYTKKDSQSVPASETSQKAAKKQDKREETSKKDLLSIIKDMKVELSTVNVQTTKPHGRKPSTILEATVGRRHRATENSPEKRNEFLSPELVAAASAVADSLPFDKQTTKSDLLKQLQQHEEESRAQKAREKHKISFRHIISDMKIARSTSARVSTRPQHQIQFDEEMDNSLDQEKLTGVKKRKGLFKGKRLFIFDVKAFADETPEAAPPSLWEIEFAKQLATVNEQPLGNGFEEMIQWTKEGKLWEFPINNEAGFDDDGSEFHEHIFLDKYLEGFPKQGPIRNFMELVTNGLSKNPYLSVKQKVEHIEWFKNYFNEKRDILKENNIAFT